MDTEPGSREISDVELLAAHVAGDAAAFGELFARHRERLWAVALRTTGDPDRAADGLQDGMVAAFRRSDSFRGDAQVGTWLHRVVVNACLDLLRRQAVRRTEPLPDDPGSFDRTDARTRPSGPADGDLAEGQVRRERRDAVLAALGRLAPEQRAAVVLVDMEGYPLAEVAQILDCPVGTVKSRCARARARLGVLLMDLWDDEDADGAASPQGNPSPAPHVGSESPRGPPASALPD